MFDSGGPLISNVVQIVGANAEPGLSELGRVCNVCNPLPPNHESHDKDVECF